MKRSQRLNRFTLRPVADSGRLRHTYSVPPQNPSPSLHWGYLARQNNLIIASTVLPDAAYTETSREADDALWRRNMKLVTSRSLFALDKNTGQMGWTYQDGLILNTTITAGKQRLFFVETKNPAAAADPLGRLPLIKLFEGPPPSLVALELSSGKLLYKQKLDVNKFQEPVYLNLSDNILLLSGSMAVGKTLQYTCQAYDVDTGRLRWQTSHDSELDGQTSS